MDLTTLWLGMQDELKQALPKEIYTNWFEDNILPYSYSSDEDLLILDTTTGFLRNYVSKKYTDVLTKIAKDVIGRPTTVKLITSQEKKPQKEAEPVAETIVMPAKHKKKSSRKKNHAASTDEVVWFQPELPIDGGPLEDPAEDDVNVRPMPQIKKAVSLNLPKKKTPQAEARKTSPAPRKSVKKETPPIDDVNESVYANNLNKDYTFDNFIVGNSNRIAVAVAKAIAQAPAEKWNPFYIYGGSGLGKTHLMHAIGHELLKNFPHMRLLCITSEDFVNEFIKCIQDKSTETFRQRYRNVDVLFVDDIQFLGRGDKSSSKEEFFHTFNKLYQDKKQMVFTSDRPPKDIKKLEDRLRSRFENGMVAQIEPPDLETRTAILRTWADKEKINYDVEALNYIAANVNENIRKLHGAFIRVLLEASQTKSKVTLPLVKHAMGYITPSPAEREHVSMDEITMFICQRYNVNYKDLIGKKKTKDITLPRQIAMYLCRKLTGNTYPHIGAAFNGRDHTTVMHACTKIAKMAKKDPHFREDLQEILDQLRGVEN